jgi:hypothetical protein
VKSTLIKKPEDSTEVTIIIDNRIDHTDLQDQITQLLIENPLSLDEFLNPEDETVLDKERESSDKEEVEQVEDNAALRAIEIVKLWKLQKGTDYGIKALDRIEREIVRYKSSQAYQTTILRFFEPK